MGLSCHWMLRGAVACSVMALVACTGDDGPSVAPCPGDGTSTACSSDTGASSSTSATSSEADSGSTSSTTALADESSTGAAAAFSVLPPFDVVGAEWVYRVENLDIEEIAEQSRRVLETFEWPDGQPGSTVMTYYDGTEVASSRYAFYGDRIELRDTGGDPVEVFHVPVDVGDEWQIEYFNGIVDVTESWRAVAVEMVEVPAGSFEAVVLELTIDHGGTIAEQTIWWVDGIGVVKGTGETFLTDLVSFSTP